MDFKKTANGWDVFNTLTYTNSSGEFLYKEYTKVGEIMYCLYRKEYQFLPAHAGVAMRPKTLGILLAFILEIE